MPAATPYQRLCDSAVLTESASAEQRQFFLSLDPVVLLQELEKLQRDFWLTATTAHIESSSQILERFIESKVPKPRIEAEPRRTRRTRIPRVWMPNVASEQGKHGRKSSLDKVWEEVSAELEKNLNLTPRQVLLMCEERYPSKIRKTQINTLTDRMRQWRFEHNLPIEFEEQKPGRKSNVDEVWSLALTLLREQPNISLNGLVRTLVQRYSEQVKPGHRTSLFTKAREWKKGNMPLDESITSISLLEEALSLVSDFIKI